MAVPSQRFKSREPFRDHEKLRFHHAQAPFSFLNPTRAHFSLFTKSRTAPPATVAAAAESTNASSQDSTQTTLSIDNNAEQHLKVSSHVRFLWRSRDNRKGRHALLVRRTPSKAATSSSSLLLPRRTSHPREVLRGIWRTFTYFPVWDISWLVAFTFTMGSIVWVINGFFSWLPAVAPSTEFDGEIYYGGGITAFIGAIGFFEVGSILLVIEAVNTDATGCFGWAVEELLDSGKEGTNGYSQSKKRPRFRLIPRKEHCRHHHQNKRNLVGKSSPQNIALAIESPTRKTHPPPGSQTWQWYPQLSALRTHYLHDLGFLAGFTQLCAATVFGVSGITALPGISNHLTPQWRLNAAYWIPQVIGGSGFILSSTLYLLETQRKWYIPAFKILGWHIAFWNLIGSIGFTLCGALGMAYKNSGAEYQAGLSTFWGSWAFLIGSYLQLYESLDKHPVEEVTSTEPFDENHSDDHLSG